MTGCIGCVVEEGRRKRRLVVRETGHTSVIYIHLTKYWSISV